MVTTENEGGAAGSDPLVVRPGLLAMVATQRHDAARSGVGARGERGAPPLFPLFFSVSCCCCRVLAPWLVVAGSPPRLLRLVDETHAACGWVGCPRPVRGERARTVQGGGDSSCPLGCLLSLACRSKNPGGQASKQHTNHRKIQMGISAPGMQASLGAPLPSHDQGNRHQPQGAWGSAQISQACQPGVGSPCRRRPQGVLFVFLLLASCLALKESESPGPGGEDSAPRRRSFCCSVVCGLGKA